MGCAVRSTGIQQFLEVTSLLILQGATYDSGGEIGMSIIRRQYLK